MSIRKEKYVDITSGIGGAAAASRRALVGRVFTTSPTLAYRGIRSFNTADEVMAYFGPTSPEYKFAVKYFGFISKSVTKAASLSFASWGYRNADKTWEFVNLSVEKDGTVKYENTTTGAKKIYLDLQKAMEEAGDFKVIDITLQKDIIYISQNTFADKNHYTDIIAHTDGVADVTSEQRLLEAALTVGKNQAVMLDLNGHKVSSDLHGIVNNGFLAINDSVGTGCVFTTNLEPMIYDLPHSSRCVDGVRMTTESVQNKGSLVINGGWYGTYQCTTNEALNETNWGNALGCYEGSNTIINGGNFTTCTFYQMCDKIAQDLGKVSLFMPRNESGVPTAAYGNEKYKPYNAIIDVYGVCHVTVNGGYFYGMSNDIFEVEGDGTTEDSFGVVVVNDGYFMSGFSGAKFVPSTKWSRQSLFQSSAPTQGYVPSKLPGADGYSVIDVRGGEIVDNVSETTTEGGQSFAFKVGDEKYPALRMTGRVRIGNVSANFEFSNEFSNYEQDYEPAGHDETPAEALSRVDETDDNFGSFCFIEKLSDAEIEEVGKLNAAKNYKYLYSVPVTEDGIQSLLARVKGMSGLCYTLDKFDDMAEFMPMAMFAATKYDRANATKCFMYQQFDSVGNSVTSTVEADKYDHFDVDGRGTKVPVNYYGCTQQAGSLVSFYQDGFNSDDVDTAIYCNEIWMKDAITVELLNLFIALEKIPANRVGKALVTTQILSVIREALKNGTICVDKELTQTQKTYIDTIADTQDAWKDVNADGYWLNVEIKMRDNRYYADYILIYSKGDAIRKVEGSDILI